MGVPDGKKTALFRGPFFRAIRASLLRGRRVDSGEFVRPRRLRPGARPAAGIARVFRTARGEVESANLGDGNRPPESGSEPEGENLPASEPSARVARVANRLPDRRRGRLPASERERRARAVLLVVDRGDDGNETRERDPRLLRRGARSVRGRERVAGRILRLFGEVERASRPLRDFEGRELSSYSFLSGARVPPASPEFV